MNIFRPAGALIALLPLLSLAACAGPAYYLQAISGHMGLMLKREEIAEILSAGEADPEVLRELKLALDLRAFAVRELGMPDNDSYTHYVRTGREAVTWNVVAAPEFSLEPRRWCFPVAGCVPYRGYFQREAAAKFADRLSVKGFDVDIAPVTAYSTLGWFADPLLDTMLQYREEQLAAVIFHELAHQRLYVRGDATFNESYASFVEQTGVTLWLQSSGRVDRLADWRRQQRAAAQFDELLLQTRASLSQLYASGAADSSKRESKAVLFRQLENDYKRLVDGAWEGRDRFGSWFSREPNNARLALFDNYRGGLCAFINLYRATGENLNRFHTQAAERAGLDAASRRAWLAQPCTAVASQDDL